MKPPSFCTGERVLIRHNGAIVPGEVLLASANGQSIAVGFDGMIAGCVRMLPLLWDPYGRTFRTIVNQDAVTIKRASEQ